MKKPRARQSFFFVDESGDATFYDARGNFIVGKAGCSPILILGFIETQDAHSLRQAVVGLHQRIIADPYLQKIPSHAKTAVALHAKDDAPEVRYLFYQLLKSLDFKTQFIVARKNEHIFRNLYSGKENKFYDDLVTRLFQNVLHRFQRNRIYFSTRGSRARAKPLKQAIWRAKGLFERRYKVDIDATAFSVEPQTPVGEPCLSIVDYMNWALYRAFTKRETRYYDFVSEKVSFLLDLHDRDAKPSNCYCRKRPFDVRKTAPLRLGS